MWMRFSKNIRRTCSRCRMFSRASIAGLIALLLSALAASAAYASPSHALSGSHLNLSASVVNETLNPNDPPISTYSVTLTNRGAATSNWVISSPLPSWLAVSPTSDSLAPGASEFLALTFTAPSSTPQTLSTTLNFSDPNADNSPLTLPVNLSIGYYSRTWYFAEGYTGGSFTEYLTLANPNPDTASVTVQYLLTSGLPLTQTYSVLSNSRYTINVNQVVGPGFSVALAITSDLPIIAERPMYFTYTGISGVSIPGGTDTLGATSLATTFAFAYLDTTAKHRTYLSILNQNSVAIQALIKYYPSAGGTAINRLHTISAKSRSTILVNNEGLGSGTFSAVVSLSATPPNTQTPALGLVERPMYLVDSATDYSGSTDVIGMANGSMSWDFAEGYTSSTFNERYILANPLSTSASRATITFFRSNGTSVQRTVALQPGQQVTVSANSVLGIGVNNSAHISADQPILAERFISFTYSGTQPIPGATDVLGAQLASDLYYFAEGYSGNGFSEYLTVENPNVNGVSLKVTFLPANGSAPTIKSYNVGATSRFTLLANSVIPGQSFSMIVQASGPVVAERPMYFNYRNSGQTGGTDIVGYAPHVWPGYNQGYCFNCIYVTNESPNAGGLDQTTGLLQWTYQSDLAAIGTPFVPSPGYDPYIPFLTGHAPYPYQTVLARTQQGYLQAPFYSDLGGYSGAGIATPYVSAANGRMFLAQTDTLYAVDQSSGTTDWTFSLADFMDSVPVNTGGAVYVTDFSGTMYSLNESTGALNWSQPLGSGSSYIASMNSIAGEQNGLIYVRLFGQSTVVVEALRTSDGSVAWTYEESQGGYDLTLDGSTIYTDDGSGVIYALDANTGALKWSTSVNNSIIMVNGGVVYVSNYGASTVEALNGATGAVQWQYGLGTNNSFDTQSVLTSSSDPGGHTLYLGVGNYPNGDKIDAINADTGALRWQFAVAEAPISNPYGHVPALEVGFYGVYYAVGHGSAVYVYGIGFDGTQLWKTELDTPPDVGASDGGMTVDSPIGVNSYISSRARIGSAPKPQRPHHPS